MTERLHALRRLLLVATGTVALATGPLAREARPGSPRRVVTVLALPGSMAEQATPDTQRLALEIAGRLLAAELHVLVSGVPTAIPLEELVATANASSTDLTIGVRSLGQSKKCAAAITPEPVPMRVQSEGPMGNAELAALVKQLMASSRTEESSKLPTALASVARWCPRRSTEVERYVLSETASPTLILSLSSGDAGALLPHILGAVQKWFCDGVSGEGAITTSWSGRSPRWQAAAAFTGQLREHYPE